jgi:hypothetical protein
MRERRTIEYENNQILKKLSILEKRRTRILQYTDQQRHILDTFRPLIPHLLTLTNIRIRHPYLFHPTTTIHNTLRRSPTDLVRYAEDVIAENTIRYDIEETMLKKQTIQQSTIQSTRDEIVENDLQINQNTAEYNSLFELRISHIQSINNWERIVTVFKTREQLIAQYRNQLDVVYTNIVAHYNNTDIRIIEEFNTQITAFEKQEMQKYAHLLERIRKQENLNSRLENEVLQPLKMYTDEMAILENIERALSPTCGIPHSYTLTFINSVIGYANKLIKAVFVYDLEILEFDQDLDIDFKFQVNVNGTPLRDISECSTAQQEIIDLTLTISLIIHKKLHHPIFLDEVGKSFDTHHKHRLLYLLNMLIDSGIATQIFIINHHAEIYDGLSNADIVVINPTNILLPQEYNTSVVIQHA